MYAKCGDIGTALCTIRAINVCERVIGLVHVACKLHSSFELGELAAKEIDKLGHAHPAKLFDTFKDSQRKRCMEQRPRVQEDDVKTERWQLGRISTWNEMNTQEIDQKHIELRGPIYTTTTFMLGKQIFIGHKSNNNPVLHFNQMLKLPLNLEYHKGHHIQDHSRNDTETMQGLSPITVITEMLGDAKC